jgi:molybdopterin-guanine dinucleotide biosynthesis protein A
MKARRAAIMAGGRGSRIGGPKAGVELAGRPLISYPIAAALQAGLQPLVVAKPDSALPPLDCELLLEPAEPVHPLIGIVAALEATAEPLVVIACDLPLVPAALIAALAARDAPLVLPADPGPQPLLARYGPELLPRLHDWQVTGGPLRRMVAELEAEVVAGDELRRFGDPATMLANVNDPADLARVEAIIRDQSGTTSTRAL